MDELTKLIELIQNKFDEINAKWTKEPNYFPIHMKKNRVEDIYKDESLLLHVFSYRQFINDNDYDVVDTIQNQKFNCTVNTRVKALNSIQYKIQNYEYNHEHGKIALKKCLNDIYGIRIIFENNINYDEIKKYIEKNFPILKCIESIRGDYSAIHVYFGNDDNYKFQWELQIWDKKHEKTNLESHEKYKQEYTKWEQENNI